MSKKLTMVLALLATMAFSVVSASAAEIKASGTYQVDAYLNNNWDFNKASEDKTFDVQQRMRTAFQFIANENLKAVLETQIGTNNWGNGLYSIGAGRNTGNGATTGIRSTEGGNGNLMLRRGYIDFNWPGTKVNAKIGYQTVALPAAFAGGSAILDDQVAAAVVSAPITDNVAITAGYARPFDSSAKMSNGDNTTSAISNGTSADMFFAAVPVTLKGYQITPFFAYLNSGHADVTAATGTTGMNTLLGMYAPGVSTDNEALRAYWGGAAFTMTAFDPFKVMADFNWGRATYSNENASRTGWLGDIAIDYTGLKFMTPELFYMYSSGENGDRDGKSHRMPVIGTPQNFSVGSFWMQGGDSLNASFNSSDSSLGYWALGLSFKDIQFIDKLSHTVNFIYFKGTNDKDSLADGKLAEGYGSYLTNKDSLFEIDVNTKYQVYDQLALMLELGYINADLDKDVWSAAGAGNHSDLSKDAYKAALMVKYSF